MCLVYARLGGDWVGDGSDLLQHGLMEFFFSSFFLHLSFSNPQNEKRERVCGPFVRSYTPFR